MNWFKGSIPEAIGTSRQKKCIFAVVVTSEQDEPSQQLLARLEEAQVANLFNNFVSISLTNGSTEAKQFGQLCEYYSNSCYLSTPFLSCATFFYADPLVVLPSIYLIDLQGTPLEIIGGLDDTPTLLSRGQAALDMLQKKANNIPTPPQKQVCSTTFKIIRNLSLIALSSA